MPPAGRVTPVVPRQRPAPLDRRPARPPRHRVCASGMAPVGGRRGEVAPLRQVRGHEGGDRDQAWVPVVVLRPVAVAMVTALIPPGVRVAVVPAGVSPVAGGARSRWAGARGRRGAARSTGPSAARAGRMEDGERAARGGRGDDLARESACWACAVASVGLAKARLQHVLTGVAMSLLHLAAWLSERPQSG
jgi:hypothetical protein